MSPVIKYVQIDCKRRFTVILLSGTNNSRFSSQNIKNGKKIFKAFFLDLKLRKCNENKEYYICFILACKELFSKYRTIKGMC